MRSRGAPSLPASFCGEMLEGFAYPDAGYISFPDKPQNHAAHPWQPSIDSAIVYAVLYIQMRFTWDPLKDRSNRRKHGISFDTAARIFLDPFPLTRQDRVVECEVRWQTIGMVDGVLLVLVAYSVVDEEEEVIRIISARKVTRWERIEYEEASKI